MRMWIAKIHLPHAASASTNHFRQIQVPILLRMPGVFLKRLLPKTEKNINSWQICWLTDLLQKKISPKIQLFYEWGWATTIIKVTEQQSRQWEISQQWMNVQIHEWTMLFPLRNIPTEIAFLIGWWLPLPFKKYNISLFLLLLLLQL